MRYAVTVGEQTFDIEVDGDAVRIDGKETPASLVGIPSTPLRQLVLGSRSRTLAVLREGETWLVQWAGERVAVTVLDERSRRLQAMAAKHGSSGGGAVVRAPMPGLVLRVEVEVGQHVTAGTGLLVLEAMKMENEIAAPTAGVVTGIRVGAGEAVEKGVALVEIGTDEG